jgi:hypothetical protein
MRNIYFLKILYYNTVFNIGKQLIGLKKRNSLEIKKTLKALFNYSKIYNTVSSSYHDISGHSPFNKKILILDWAGPVNARRNPENSGVISVENWCALPGLMGPDICAG